MPVVRTVLGAVDEVASVVAGAVEAAVAEKLRRREIGTNLLRRRPEVVDRVLLIGKDGAIRNKDIVNTNTLTGERQTKSVV